MINDSASLICSVWSQTVKALLIALVALILLAVIVLLVVEIVGKRNEVYGAPQGDYQPVRDNAELASALLKHIPEPDQDEIDIGVTLEDEQEEEFEEEDGEYIPLGAVFVEGGKGSGIIIINGVRINVMYNRSFTALLTQADDNLKGFYSELKNELLGYGLTPRMSWSNESWHTGGMTYAKFAIRGKTLSLYMALNPDDYAGTKYRFRNASKIAKYRNIPMQVKIKSARALMWAKELVAEMAAKNGLAKTEIEPVNFRPDYKNIKTLVGEKLIKLRFRANGESTPEDLEDAAIKDIKLRDRAPRDFTTRLMHADGKTKEYYSAVKNELLRYGLIPRMSLSCESWYKGRNDYAKLAIRGKTLSLFMALNPEEIGDTQYSFLNAASGNKFSKVPLRIKFKSDRAVELSKELLAVMAQKNDLQRTELEEEDYRYVDLKKKK